MRINRCISCEKEIEGYPCPYCGFDASSYQQPEYALPCDTVLNGRYLVGKVLGQGGFGITYVGWDLVLQYKCAIKEFYPNGQAIRDCSLGLNLRWSNTAPASELRRSGMESFLREARKMYKVDHVPEVVRVRDTFIQHDTAYIVMDFVEGQMLKIYLEQHGTLSWAQAEKIFLPVIDAMEKVHQAGLVHRDLSPDNLMLLPNGGVKILDLGAAKDLSVNSGASSMQVAKGGFSPLEQYTQRGGSGPWSDVYALAATMYYSLTGILPPTAVDRIEADTIAWDLPQLKALPRVVLTALQKAMAVTAAKRTQSMAELLKQLQSAPKPKPPKPVKVKQEKPPKPEKVKKEKPPKEPKPERKPIPKKYRILAAVLALVILGGLIYNAIPAPAKKQLAVPEETTSSAETVPTESPEPTEPPHVHDWAPATVGRPARCESCGLMTGTSLPLTIRGGDFGIKSDGTLIQAEPDQLSEYDTYELDADYFLTGTSIVRQKDGTLTWGGLWNHFEDGSEEGLECLDDIVELTYDYMGLAAGLRRDGTVVTVRFDYSNITGADVCIDSDDSLNLESWTDIVDVAGVSSLGDYSANYSYAIGLKADGTLVFACEEDWFQEAKSWTDIVAIDTCWHGLLGLKADGTVVAAWRDEPDSAAVAERRAEIEAWTDIVQLDSEDKEVVALKADGSVVATSTLFRSEVSSWKDMVAVNLNDHCVIGLRADGTTASVFRYQASGAFPNRWSDIKLPQPQPVPQEPTAPAETGAEAAHTHTWAPATVGSPARCESCGLMTGMALPSTISSFMEGYAHAYGVKNDGTVLATRIDGAYPNKHIGDWENIASVSEFYGIREDGTVAVPAFAENEEICKSVAGWTDMVSVAGRWPHAAGLRRDGTVITVGTSRTDYAIEGEAHLHTESWTDIVNVAIGTVWANNPAGRNVSYPYTIGLKTDGTLVMAVEKDVFPEAGAWTDIVAVDSDGDCLFGLRADGTVAIDTADSGMTAEAKARIEAWSDIIQLDADMGTVAGLKADGTVVTEVLNWNDRTDYSEWQEAMADWKNIVAVRAANESVLGLKADGTAVVAYLDHGTNAVHVEQNPYVWSDRWTDIRVPQPVPQEPTAPAEIPTQPVENTEEGDMIPEYQEIYQKNQDAVGWLRISNTQIGYPVMQTPDDPNYYLYRDFDGNDSKVGSIYAWHEADINKPSDNIAMFGPNMVDGSMFATLQNYVSKSTWEDNPYIFFDTLYEYHTYRIFAVFKTSANEGEGFSYHSFVDAENEAEFDEFVSTCKELSFYDTGITPKYGDKLICLSTCEYTLDNGRLVVAAVRLS